MLIKCRNENPVGPPEIHVFNMEEFILLLLHSWTEGVCGVGRSLVDLVSSLGGNWDEGHLLSFPFFMLLHLAQFMFTPVYIGCSVLI